MPFDVGTVAWQALLNPHLGFDGVHMSRDGAGVGEGEGCAVQGNRLAGQRSHHHAGPLCRVT